MNGDPPFSDDEDKDDGNATAPSVTFRKQSLKQNQAELWSRSLVSWVFASIEFYYYAWIAPLPHAKAASRTASEC